MLLNRKLKKRGGGLIPWHVRLWMSYDVTSRSRRSICSCRTESCCQSTYMCSCSRGKSKEVEALIGSLTNQQDKHDSTKLIRTIDDIKIGDSVRLKAGIHLKYDDVPGVERQTSIGKISEIRSKDMIYVNFQMWNSFKCTLDDIEFAW